MNRLTLPALIAMAGILLAGSLKHEAGAASQPYVANADAISAGRYLVSIGACNECHTPGYEEAKGNVPTAKLLTGSPVGFEGSWGVSYPVNLRLMLANISVDAWLQFIKLGGASVHPPMPWTSLQRLSEGDQRAVYAYIHSLGPAGKVMPAYVPPGGKVTTSVILFQPIPEAAAVQAAGSAKR